MGACAIVVTRNQRAVLDFHCSRVVVRVRGQLADNVRAPVAFAASTTPVNVVFCVIWLIKAVASAAPSAGNFAVVLEFEQRHLMTNHLQILHDRAFLRVLRRLAELRQDRGGENAEDDNHDQDFDQREAGPTGTIAPASNP